MKRGGWRHFLFHPPPTLCLELILHSKVDGEEQSMIERESLSVKYLVVAEIIAHWHGEETKMLRHATSQVEAGIKTEIRPERCRIDQHPLVASCSMLLLRHLVRLTHAKSGTWTHEEVKVTTASRHITRHEVCQRQLVVDRREEDIESALPLPITSACEVVLRIAVVICHLGIVRVGDKLYV